MTRTVFIKLEGKRFDEKPRRDSSSPVRRVNVRSEVPSPTTPFRVLEQTTTDPSYPSGSTTAAPPNIPRLPEIVTILAVPAPTYREQRKAAQGRPAYKPRYWARVLDPDATVDMVVQMTKMETGMEARVLDEIWLGKSSAEKDVGCNGSLQERWRNLSHRGGTYPFWRTNIPPPVLSTCHYCHASRQVAKVADNLFPTLDRSKTMRILRRSG